MTEQQEQVIRDLIRTALDATARHPWLLILPESVKSDDNARFGYLLGVPVLYHDGDHVIVRVQVADTKMDNPVVGETSQALDYVFAARLP